MTETTPPPASTPFDSLKGIGSGAIVALAGIGVMLWAALRKKGDDEALREYDREHALNQQLELAKAARGIERAEERHAASIRMIEEQHRCQIDFQACARAERFTNEAKLRAEKARERYYADRLDLERGLAVERAQLIERQAAAASAQADYLRSQTPTEDGSVSLDRVLKTVSRHLEPILRDEEVEALVQALRGLKE